MERIDYVDLMTRARRDEEMIALAAQCILQDFDDYYAEFLAIPARAKQAFEARDPGESLLLSRRRLGLYSESIRALADKLTRVFPLLAEDAGLWSKVEAAYLPLVRERYEEDLTVAYIHSARRVIFRDEWTPVDYSFGDSALRMAGWPRRSEREFPGGPALAAETVLEILAIPDFTLAYRDPRGDAALVAERVNRDLGLDPDGEDWAIEAVEMIDAGFYRNRGAYIVGRMMLAGGGILPLVLALEADDGGVFVDAVLTEEADVHNIFSSTLANFHVTNPHYHETAAFLQTVMPARPLGLHYTTIGYNHLGKVAVMDDLREERDETGEAFATAVGFRGTVAIGFSAPSSAYVLKVIRDHPTAQYKWGRFEGVPSVLAKYRRVHEINRTGSMLDNVIYANVRLERDWFEPALLDELLAEAGGTVSLRRDGVLFKHLIVQLKMIPLPVFLEKADEEEAAQAVINLGHCIKNNAAANIFNKDLDGRNYGVSHFLKVFLFDYDALEPFTEVKVRTNLDRIDGEEDPPDWVFEEGVIFLPEEIEAGLRIDDRALRRRFRAAHGDLLTPAYWEALQGALEAGRVPRISIYPEARRLRRGA